MAYFQDVLLRRTKTHPSKTNKREVEKRLRREKIIKAIREGNTNEVFESIKSGVDIDLVDQVEGRSALSYAALFNNKDVVQALIEAGADVNKSDNYGKTPLSYCAEKDYLYTREVSRRRMLIDGGKERNKVIDLDSSSVASALIEAGAHINLADNQGVTPLMYALQNNERLTSALIDAGADVKIIDKNGRNALHYASINGNENIVSQLTNSIDIDLTDNQGKTALMLAVQHGQTSVAAKLIDAGAEVNGVDKEGITTLMHFAQGSQMTMRMYGNEDRENEDAKGLASMIIKAVPDLNVTDKEGKTALIYSLKGGNRNLTCKLIDAGADVNVVDRSGKTALFYAAIYGFRSIILQLFSGVYDSSCPKDPVETSFVNRCYDEREIFTKLINAGADVDITDQKGKTALMYLAENECHGFLGTPIESADPLSKYVDQVEHNYNILASSLMKASGDINKVDNHGKTALTYFLQNNKDFVAMALINSGAVVNIVDDDGKTALFYVPETCSNTFINEMINISTDINIADNEGVTPLMYALQNSERLALALIDTGADVKIIDKNGRNALHYASINGNENIVSQLTNSIDIDLTDNQGKTALIYAVQHGQTSVAAKLIDAGADVNGVDKEGKTALIYGALDDSESRECQILKYRYMSTYHDDGIAKNRPKSVVSLLIEAGADLNIADNQGKTALIHAVRHGQTNLVAKLIDAGADVNVVDKEGKTALIYGAQDDSESRERQILKYRFMSTYHDDGIAKNKPKSVVSMLIEAGADLNIADNQGKTALIHAVKGDNENLTLELIDGGADVKVADNDGRTAILYAILCKNEKLIQALIKAGKNASMTDIQGKTALIHLAQDEGGVSRLHDSFLSADSEDINYMWEDASPKKIDSIDYKKVASMLIEAGAEIDVTDNEGKTALIYSLQNNKENLACALIEAGADVKTVDKSGRTALFYALFTGIEKMAHKLERTMISFSDSEEDSIVSLTNAQESRESVIARLIEAGADISITYTEGKTALIYSVEEDDESLARALIEAGADVNVSDEEGKTALIYSVQNNNEGMVSLLIEAGADVNIVDHDSKTALFYGVRNEKIVLLLINNGKASINKRDKYSRSPLFYAILKSLTSARYLLEKGSGLHRKDCYNINILSFFIEHCLRQSFDHCYMSDGLKLLEEKGIKRENIFEALINSVFCMILFTTLGLQGRKKVGLLSQKPDIREVIWVLNLAKQYASEDDGKRCETIQNTIMMMEEATDLCVAMPTILDSLVVLGANPSYADIDGNTALHYAACLPLAGASQDTVMKICHQLDDLEAPFYARNHQKETPLLFCLSKKDWINKGNESTKLKTLVEVCTFLLEQGSSLEEITQNEKSVFHLIMELFAQALQLHDDIARKDVLNETLALLHLFPSSHVTKGVTVNKRDGSLNSPLHIWAMLNFRILARNKDSSTVDPYAFEKQILTAIFNHLIDCGAKLSDGNGKDQTPLHLCKTWTAAKLLIDAGAKTNFLDHKGSPPLLVTIKRNRNVINKSDDNFIYADVLQQPKEFWKTLLENKLDPWTVNINGNSVMSILVESEAFAQAKALLVVACDGNYIQTDAIAVSLLNAICKDQSSSAQWKSILVDQILKSRKNTIHLRDGEDTPLHHCCRNIIRQMDELSLIWRTLPCIKYDFLNEITTSVHWTIVKQLLSHRFDCNVCDGSGQSCIDIAQKHPALEALLKKQINISEVDIPVVIRWTSISKTHKSTLAKVARQQECRQVNSLWYHRNNIQKGSFGLVFVGINQKDGREVAIKRIEKLRMHRPEDKREITNLTKLADCEQVVRYLFFFDDEDFSYVVLELMEGNLYEYFGSTEFDAKRSIRLCADVVRGLGYLHDKGIIHRDLKPSNILFKTSPHLCLKIADFGLSRCIDKCSTSATVYGSVAGTRCWIAPEVLKSSYKEHSMASDVFSCGLLLHYIQVKKHPFSPADCSDKNDLQINSAIEDNILNGNMEGWDPSLCSETTELIKHMLNSDKGKRPTAADGLAHPFFWSKKKKIDFLIGVGNQPEIEVPRAKIVPPLTPVENDLEKSFGTIITKPSWNDSGYASMQHIYTEMTKKKKWPYDTGSVVALVRFIRNAYAHISEDKRPPAIRKLLLEDFVFLEYFPSLVMEVLKCVRNHGWDLRYEIKYAIDDI